MDWIVLLVPFLLFLVYYAVGGGWRDGGPSPSAEPPRPPMPGGPQIGTTTSLPRRGAGAGFSRADRLAEIDAFYGNDLNPIGLRMADLVPAVIPADSLRRMGEAAGRRPVRISGTRTFRPTWSTKSPATSNSGPSPRCAARCFPARLRDLQDAERAGLRLADMLEALGVLSPADVLGIRLPIVWNDGKCLVETIPAFGHADRMQELECGRRHRHWARRTDRHGARAGRTTRCAGPCRPRPSPRRIRPCWNAIFAGARWLTSAEVPTYIQSPRDRQPDRADLGAFDDGREPLFDMAESLVTIASPGSSGKSQAHVLRNLLRYRGGGVVLDIKGEMFERSAAWRSTLGTVARYAPGDPASVSFNPLD